MRAPGGPPEVSSPEPIPVDASLSWKPTGSSGGGGSSSSVGLGRMGRGRTGGPSARGCGDTGGGQDRCQPVGTPHSPLSSAPPLTAPSTISPTVQRRKPRHREARDLVSLSRKVDSSGWGPKLLPPTSEEAPGILLPWPGILPVSTLASVKGGGLKISSQS